MLLLLPSGRGGAAPSDPSLALNADGSAAAPAAFIQALKSNAQAMAGLRVQNPPLAKIIDDEDVVALQASLER